MKDAIQLIAALVVFVCATDLSANDDIYEGRIKLVSKLDEPDGLCLDLPGPMSNLLLHIPAWAHTCKPQGSDIRDMTFRFDASTVSTISNSAMAPPLCLAVDEISQGSQMHFVECDEDSDNQKFRYIDKGRILLESTRGEETALCLTVETAAPSPRGSRPRNDDPKGHSTMVNLRASHMARSLMLEDCAAAPLEMSQWEAYRERELNPF